MQRQIQQETARSFATQCGYMYFEASAKSGQKEVNEVFCVGAAKALDIPLPAPKVRRDRLFQRMRWEIRSFRLYEHFQFFKSGRLSIEVPNDVKGFAD